MKLSFKSVLTNKFIRDFIINAVASALPVVILQFLIEPLMSRYMTDDFGLMITVVSLFTMISTIFGNTLNNVLLLKHNKIDNELKDYNVIFIIFQILSSVALILILIFVYNVKDFITLAMIGIVGISSTFFAYCSAQFRMEFKYHLFLICEIGKAVGYVAGYFLFRLTGEWYYVFLIAAIIESILCLLFTNVWRYPYKKSDKFKEISFVTIFILGSSLSVTLVNYFDKLILYPFMGGDSVSVYNSATIIAKGLSLITTPLGSVLLGYLVKKEFISKNQLLKLLLAFSIAIIPLYFIFYFASKWILPYMYPSFYEEAYKLLIFTTLFAIINIYISLCEPILLTHNGERISLYYGIEKAILSILFGFIGIWVNGLYGFCVFRLVSTLLVFTSLVSLLFYRRIKFDRANRISLKIEKSDENSEIESE